MFKRLIVGCIFLGACNTATVSMNYATTDIGVHNGGKYRVGKIFKWMPGSNHVLDLEQVPASTSEDANHNTKDIARDVSGWVVSTSFNANSQQIAAIEGRATKNTQIEYRDYTIHESNNTRGAISQYINSKPEIVAQDWGLADAIVSHKNSETTDDVYYVAVFKTITTSKTSLTAGSEVGGKAEVDVPGMRSAVEVSFEGSSDLLCEGVQRCFFDVRIYKPIRNDAGNYDFIQSSPYRSRDFIADLKG